MKQRKAQASQVAFAFDAAAELTFKMVLQNPQATAVQRDLHLHAVAREQWVDVLPAQWRQVGQQAVVSLPCAGIDRGSLD